MFTDYDGNKSTFGNLYAYSVTNDSVNTSIYSSITAGKDEVHIIAINKNLDESYTGEFNIISDKNITEGKTWYIDETSSEIQHGDNITGIQSNSFEFTLPRASVTHFVLKADAVLSVYNKELPDEYKLSVYPNPFNPSCRLNYSVPNNDKAALQIIDINGKLIRSFIELSGTGHINWNGINQNNEPVASGMYFVLLRGTNTNFISQKIMLLK
jgi:hypothetical protein